MADAEPENDAVAASPQPDPVAAAVDPVAADPLTKSDLDASSASTRSRLFLAIVATLVVGIIIGRVSASGDDSGGDGGEAATATSAAGLPFPAGDQDRANYWGLAGLEPVVNDAFDRGDNPDGLGRASTGQQWNEVRGQWAVSQHQAQVVDPGPGERPPLAVTPGGEGDGLTEVTMPVVQAGAGLVFRYLDPDNYWSVLADPDTGTWSVFKTLDGDSELVSDVEASTANGVTVTIIQDGTRLRVLVEGEDVLLLDDEDLSDHLQAGLIAPPGGDATARWDRFLVMHFRTSTPTTSAG